ncbi:MAG: hypothetical protein WB780_14315 [Candidatus Acidiferrales bacterium]
MISHSRLTLVLLSLTLGALCGAPRGAAQDTPYFVTYSHHLEEPGSLEIELSSNYATQRGAGDFIAPWIEFEYGAKAWWTTEFYLDSQKTFSDGVLYTGLRWENRFRPLMKEHWINPVIYVEFEDTNGADKTMIEVVGFDSQNDHAVRNAIASREHDHEIETKLILSSDPKGWNISENFIAEKNLGHDPYEFGYAIAASRPLRLAATPTPCNFCRENIVAGIEMYGGLGTTDLLSLSRTSHYVAPILAWHMPSGLTLRASPSWGLTSASHRFLLRWGLTYEISGFGDKVRKLFR